MTIKGMVTCEQGKCRARTRSYVLIQEEVFGHQDRLEQKTEDKTKGKKRSDQKRRFRTQFNS